MNDTLKTILDDFTNPYHNDKVSDLYEEILKDLELEYAEDIKNYLIAKKGAYELMYEYSEEYIKYVQQKISEVQKNWS